MWHFGVWISKVARKPTVELWWVPVHERTRLYSDSPGIWFKFSGKGSAAFLEVNPQLPGLACVWGRWLTSKNNCFSAGLQLIPSQFLFTPVFQSSSWLWILISKAASGGLLPFPEPSSGLQPVPPLNSWTHFYFCSFLQKPSYLLFINDAHPKLLIMVSVSVQFLLLLNFNFNNFFLQELDLISYPITNIIYNFANVNIPKCRLEHNDWQDWNSLFIFPQWFIR